MKKLYALLAVSFISILAGCEPKNPTSPQLPASPEQQQCVQNCLTVQDRCVKKYYQIYEQCTFQKKEQAKLDYQAYLKQQANKQEEAEKQQADFLNLSSCEQQLNCSTGYDKCYNRCTS